MLGLSLPGLEFRILCPEGSFISFISPSSGGSPGPVKLSLYIISDYVHKGGLKPHSFSFPTPDWAVLDVLELNPLSPHDA